VRRVVVIVAVLGLAFGGVTLAALEGREVVRLRTRGANGAEHETRAWVADADGYEWVEAANAERPFLQRIQAGGGVDLWRDGAWRSCTATPEPPPAGHARIRGLLAAKYGWADRWIGLLADTSGSWAVRLDCRAPPARPAGRRRQPGAAAHAAHWQSWRRYG
jgi:hypothetical protein